MASIDDMLLDICIRETCKAIGRPVNANLLAQVKQTTGVMYRARHSSKPAAKPVVKSVSAETKTEDTSAKPTGWPKKKKKYSSNKTSSE